MSSSLLHLAVESRDLFQAEKIHKMTTQLKVILGEILSENSCHFVNLLTLQMFPP